MLTVDAIPIFFFTKPPQKSRQGKWTKLQLMDDIVGNKVNMEHTDKENLLLTSSKAC